MSTRQSTRFLANELPRHPTIDKSCASPDDTHVTLHFDAVNNPSSTVGATSSRKSLSFWHPSPPEEAHVAVVARVRQKKHVLPSPSQARRSIVHSCRFSPRAHGKVHEIYPLTAQDREDVEVEERLTPRPHERMVSCASKRACSRKTSTVQLFHTAAPTPIERKRIRRRRPSNRDTHSSVKPGLKRLAKGRLKHSIYLLGIDAPRGGSVSGPTIKAWTPSVSLQSAHLSMEASVEPGPS